MRCRRFRAPCVIYTFSADCRTTQALRQMKWPRSRTCVVPIKINRRTRCESCGAPPFWNQIPKVEGSEQMVAGWSTEAWILANTDPYNLHHLDHCRTFRWQEGLIVDGFSPAVSDPKMPSDISRFHGNKRLWTRCCCSSVCSSWTKKRFVFDIHGDPNVLFQCHNQPKMCSALFVLTFFRSTIYRTVVSNTVRRFCDFTLKNTYKTSQTWQRFTVHCTYMW